VQNPGSGRWLAVGAVVTTARFPRFAKCLQLGQQVVSESVTLGRIHIQQMFDSLLMVVWLLGVGFGGGFEQGTRLLFVGA
jgi:hypothetical protein